MKERGIGDGQWVIHIRDAKALCAHLPVVQDSNRDAGNPARDLLLLDKIDQ